MTTYNKEKRHQAYLKAKERGAIKKMSAEEAREYRSSHLETMRANQRSYYAKHREERIAAAKQYDEAHEEQRKERARRYYERHKDQINAKRRKGRGQSPSSPSKDESR